MTDALSTTPSSQFVLKQFVQGLSETPGVYRFYSEKRELLYVGKAKNLKKRVTSYLRKQSNTRLSTLVSQIAHIEITLTRTENEALLLERNLIKSLKPHYNVLLRDDKTYPYLILSAHKKYPRLYTYRGRPKQPEEHFGPYPNILAMRESLQLLQRLFKLRSCHDTFFKNRTRPCLQYQIKRCTAPCVGFISAEDYQKDVEKVRLLLNGKNSTVIQTLTQQMEAASHAQDYEKAAYLLTQITALRQVQQQQAIIAPTGDNMDVISWESQVGLHCVYVLPIRHGEILGGQAYFPVVPSFLEKSAILSQFISQFYLETSQLLPKQILVDTRIEDQLWVANALAKQHATPLVIRHRPKRTELEWLAFAQKNARHALEQELRSQRHQHNQRYALQKALHLSHPPERLECFDISHSQGESTVASCVVFDAEGPAKKDYRRFSIKNITPGDDYAALKQALTRRYTSLNLKIPLPDILIIDGGKGQLTQAITVLKALQLEDKIQLMAIAKGPGRKPGYETLFLTQARLRVTLESDDPALHLLQHIRDEAHRFAITTHRKQRDQKRRTSVLEAIPGIGPKKRQQLLTQFEGLQGLKRASLHELNQVPGMTPKLADTIYATLKELD